MDKLFGYHIFEDISFFLSMVLNHSMTVLGGFSVGWSQDVLLELESFFQFKLFYFSKFTLRRCDKVTGKPDW